MRLSAVYYDLALSYHVGFWYWQIIRGKKQVTLHGTGTQVKDSATKVEKICREEGIMQKVEGFLDRPHGGGAPSESIVKELPKVGDADPFLKDIMNNMGTPFGSECLLQPLERFPSLNLDFPLDEILAATPKSPKSPKPEPTGWQKNRKKLQDGQVERWEWNEGEWGHIVQGILFTSAGMQLPCGIQWGPCQCEHDTWHPKEDVFVGIESPLWYFNSTFDKQG